jgi:antitoxin (DNA-binding transcriptional repressor) of toxin-antitoxin stability system
MAGSETISATDFKAKCLEILDRISNRELERAVVTKRGRVVAVLVRPEDEADQIRRLHGFMRGSVVVPPGTDLTEPTVDEPFSAVRGKLHE